LANDTARARHWALILAAVGDANAKPSTCVYLFRCIKFLIYVDIPLRLTFIFCVNSIAERWVLAGKNIFNRWRSWRDPGAELLDLRMWLLPNSRLGLSGGMVCLCIVQRRGNAPLMNI